MAHYTRYVWKVKVDSHGSWSQVFSKTPALDTTKVYWARRRGEHNRLERTAQTRAEGAGGGAAGGGSWVQCALLLGGSGPPPSSSALLLGGAGISVQTAAVSSMRSSCENLWSASKSVVSPAGPPTANRAVRGTPASLLRLSCLAAPLRQGGKIRLSQPIIRRGTAGSTAGCTRYCSLSSHARRW